MKSVVSAVAVALLASGCGSGAPRGQTGSTPTQGVQGGLAMAGAGENGRPASAACDGDDSDEDDNCAPTIALTCDDSMKTAFRPDANTTVTLVKAFKKGDRLALSGTPASPPPLVASNDVCLVKLNVGPGNPGPADAPSTSAGIGMEIWLPTPANWNQRTKSTGDGAFAGNPTISSLTGLRTDVASWALDLDYVSSISDSGHVSPAGISIGSWAMNPDGSPNTTLWTDHSTRSIHELALKTKALAAAYYLKPAKYVYYGGCSGGGRTGYAAAQSH